MRSFSFSVLLLIGLAGPVTGVAAEAVTPTQCGPGDSGSPCGGDGPASQGNNSDTNQGAGNPINVITGNKYQQETDLPALPGVLGLEIVRHYNSVQSGPRTPPGILGRGWRLSYETDLYAIGNTLQIVQADGTRIIFIRDPKNPSLCATNNPAHGRLAISKTPRGDEYRWTWTNGRTLSFNHQGRLTEIRAPSGEFVSLTRDLAGALVKVTDPQGRSLIFGYPAKRDPNHFNGVTHIQSPVGRFAYTYGSAVPTGIASGSAAPSRTAANGASINPRDLLANLVRVDLPGAIQRHYHYEDPAHPTLLTGISVAGPGAAQRAQPQRLSTWAYDAQGRGILSVKGGPKRIGQGGKPIPGTGIEQVQLSYAAGKTILTNSLNQTTTYTHAIVGNEHRLLNVTGAGCASCGETNVRYGYDKLGRLTQTTRLSSTGQPLATTQTQRDPLGRPIRIDSIAYQNGQAQPANLQVRYEYLDQSNQPTLIARPSVIAGKEAITRISYNPAGQPIQITETGFSPLDDKAQRTATTIQRITTYSYNTINGRSLLTQIDGPLANGKANSPIDSDITKYTWDKRGSYLTVITHPMNLSTKVEYDEGGRANKVTGVDGVITHTRYNTQSQIEATQRYPASLSLQAAKDAGLLLTTATRYDALGRIIQSTRPDGQSIKLSYASNGQLAQLSDGLGNRVEWKDWKQPGVTTQQWFSADAPTKIARAWYFWHDSQNRLTQRLNPDGGLDQWDYPQNSSGWRTYTDPLGRMTARAQNNNAAAQVRITPEGYIDASLSSGRIPDIQTATPVQQTQDDFGRIVQFASSQHGTQRAQYNAADQIIHIIQADGTHIRYAYDAAGRVMQKRADQPNKSSSTIRYRYTVQGLAVAEDPIQTTAYSYDPLGRQIEKRITLNQHGYSIRTRFDARGRIKAKQLADGNWLVFTQNDKTGITQSITLHRPILPAVTQKLAAWFNAPDLPLTLAWRSTVVTDIQASPLDGITHYTHGNGTATDYRFDQAGRLAGIEHGKATGPILKASYQYDPVQRLASENINKVETKYAYQDWDRLAQSPANPSIQAQYDRAGRTTHDTNYHYQYDTWGKLQSVSTSNKVVATYAHNAYGERVKASYPNGQTQQTRYYLYDNQKRVAEIDQHGKILQQYLYLNDKPIAVIDTATGDSEIIALHTDRRGAPVAASGEQGKVIWTASYNAWGQARIQNVAGKQAANEATFNLDLRLPGQWEDRATHLHYNYQRDYNPTTGKYLTPDPLGFPDGPDAYLYVGGDPVNKVDPLGLYSTEVHYYLTYFLARMAGVDAQTAYTIALGAQYIDDNPMTEPINLKDSGHIKRLQSYHFTQAGYDKTGDVNTRIQNPWNPQLARLLGASNRAPHPCARAQFFGEFLHTFQDTFAHRDRDNDPISTGIFGDGHLFYGESPDKTYVHQDKLGLWWWENETRTLRMEKEVFARLQAYAGRPGINKVTGKPITFADLSDGYVISPYGKVLEQFNNERDPLAKIMLLDAKLVEFGFGPIPPYDEVCAAAKRDEYIGGLKESDFPGTILPKVKGKAGSAAIACGG